jgi:type I restriction enzyme S subunit
VTPKPPELPPGWARVPLRDLGVWRGGGTPSKSNPAYWTDGTIPWVSPKDMKVRRIFDAEDHITASAVDASATNLIGPGSLLVVTRSGILRHSLPIAIAQLEMAINQDLKALTLHPGIDPRFAALALERYEQDILHTCTKAGTTVQSIEFPIFLNFEISTPPTGEQRRIVAEIEKQFTRLDAAVAALKRVQKELNRYRASVLKAAYEGRLVPTEAEVAQSEGRDYEHADKLLIRLLNKRRTKWETDGLAKMKAAGKDPRDDKWKDRYSEPPAPDTTSLPSLPEGWKWCSIGQTIEVSVGATPSRARPEYWGGTIRWVSSGEVRFCRIKDTRERITELGLENTSTNVHPPGTVLLGMIGEGRTRGQAAILDVSACNNQNSAAILVSEAGLPAEYLYRFLESTYDHTRRLGSGNNQPALNKSRVQAITFPMAPLTEQVRIVTEVEGRISVLEALERSVIANLRRAERLRQAVLKRAFDGRLVPQDPKDEPAGILLERLRDRMSYDRHGTQTQEVHLHRSVNQAGRPGRYYTSEPRRILIR